MRCRHVPIAVALALVITLVAGCDDSRPSRSVTVKLNWQHGADFLGFYVAAQRGYYAEEGLEAAIEPLADPLKYKQTFDDVAGSGAEFSLAGSSLAYAQARGLPLVAIANISKLNPGTLLARRESGIRTPADLAGKRVAIKNENWRNNIAQLIAEFGLTLGDIVEVQSGFDMAPFYEGKVDVWSGFIQDEPVRARFAGLDIVTLPFHEYGFPGSALTIFTSRSLLDAEPDLAVRFTRATLRGWQWAIEHPAAAIDLMIERHPELAAERAFHVASFQASIPLILPDGALLGAMDCDYWMNREELAELPSRDGLCTTRVYEAAMGAG